MGSVRPFRMVGRLLNAFNMNILVVNAISIIIGSLLWQGIYIYIYIYIYTCVCVCVCVCVHAHAPMNTIFKTKYKIFLS